MGPLYLGKKGTFVNFRYINNLAAFAAKNIFYIETMLLHLLGNKTREAQPTTQSV